MGIWKAEDGRRKDRQKSNGDTTLSFTLTQHRQCRRYFCRQHAPAASRQFLCQPPPSPPLHSLNHFSARIPSPHPFSIGLVHLPLLVPPSLVNHGRSFPSPQALLRKCLRHSLPPTTNQIRPNSSRYCCVLLDYSNRMHF